ncbi:sulfotransferase ssu-1-like [Dermacentor andersoni]|uniref:sulfotransferase ssu-1-like n=1 Tax=Dermacentor andersoni TaxID=34620 RepID=UPI003B3BD251
MSPKRPYFQLVNGVPRPPVFDPVVFKRCLNLKFKEGDVLLSTYPKSGTKWLVYVMQLILKEGKPVINFEDFLNNARGVEFMDDEDWQTMLPFRIHFTHQPLCRDNMGETAKFVYLARNPWDVCASFYDMLKDLSVYRFQDGSFEDFLDGFLAGDFGFGSYFEHVASGYALKDEPHVFFTTYEELKRDTKGTCASRELRHLAHMSEFAADAQYIKAVVIELADALIRIGAVNYRVQAVDWESFVTAWPENTQLHVLREGKRPFNLRPKGASKDSVADPP